MMRSVLSPRFLLILVSLIFVIPISASSQYRAVISSAGGTATSTSYSVKFTLGEPIPGGVASSESYRVTTGFYGGDVFGPVINEPSFEAGIIAGGSVNVTSEISDAGSGVGEVTLRYGAGGGMLNSSCTMVEGDAGVYSCDIEGGIVQSQGVMYQIEAIDLNGNLSLYPDSRAENITVQVSGISSAIRSGTSSTAYQLISTPFTLSNRSFTTLIPSLSNDTNEWRYFELKNNYADLEDCQPDSPESCYTESPSTMAEGKAYFVISRSGGEIEIQEGETKSTVETRPVPLHKGWNMIGNLYDFALPISNLQLDSEMPLTAQRFSNGNWTSAVSLEPFGGIIVDGGEGGEILIIDPFSATNGGAAGKNDQREDSKEYVPEWAVEIEAHSGEQFDIGNLAGVHGDAKAEWDWYDRPEPLLFGDFISVHFPHQEWNKVHKMYAADVREKPGVWDFNVSSAVSRATTLRFSAVESVPDQYDVVLVDRKMGRTQDLRMSPEYALMSPGNGAAHAMQLVIGESIFVEEILESVDVTPEGVELDQNYPNPFNPTTSIRYGLATDATVSLTVYNLLGQAVATLVNNESRSAGYHTAIWDARGSDGLPLASSVYVYQLRATPVNGSAETISTKKMLLLK